MPAILAALILCACALPPASARDDGRNAAMDPALHVDGFRSRPGGAPITSSMVKTSANEAKNLLTADRAD